MLMIVRRVNLLLVVLVALAGCGSSQTAGTAKAAYVGNWKAEASAQHDGWKVVSISVDADGRIRFVGPCNATGSTYSVGKNGLAVRPFESMTSVGCLVPEPSLSPTGPLTLTDNHTVLVEPTPAGDIQFTRVP